MKATSKSRLVKITFDWYTVVGIVKVVRSLIYRKQRQEITKKVVNIPNFRKQHRKLIKKMVGILTYRKKK